MAWRECPGGVTSRAPEPVQRPREERHGAARAVRHMYKRIDTPQGVDFFGFGADLVTFVRPDRTGGSYSVVR